MSAQPKHDVFQAVADPTRRQLLQLLAGRELPVTVIAAHFPISRTAVSKHLRVLAEAGLVKERKIGRETRYRMEAEPLLELKKWLDFYERFWENKLEALRRYVESDGQETGSAAGPLGIAGPGRTEEPS
ncbi:ArsR/SmtB family transcription factor [Paenibacillus sp. S-38]|uniref:ArsR/SmtB family transcription factor n=1 Tax=Paenibacillus sp. S-38 TaxID=3416710 RepID=UPI003CF476B3